MIDRRLLDLVEVDSGTLVIGDPAYILPSVADGRLGVDFGAVIASDDPIGSLDQTPALLLQAFGGDGSFPVFGEYEDGELVRVTIEFLAPEE
jgi:hypothetical protein